MAEPYHRPVNMAIEQGAPAGPAAGSRIRCRDRLEALDHDLDEFSLQYKRALAS